MDAFAQTPSSVDSSSRSWPWLMRPVLRLDRLLRERQGIYEYTRHPGCLFRIEQAQADETLSLGDGTCILHGEPVLKLHLWNEQIPLIGPHGPTIGWARRASRAVEVSLRELARYLRSRTELEQFTAICADMRLATARESAQLARIVTRYGFEPRRDFKGSRHGVLHSFGESILMCMLVLATNPAALRGSVFRRDYVRVYLSRRTLQRRYGRMS